MSDTIGTPSLWVGFTLFVVTMLALDLGIFHRKAHGVGGREALGWSVFWITLALVFNAGVLHWFGPARFTVRIDDGRRGARLFATPLLLAGSVIASLMLPAPPK